MRGEAPVPPPTEAEVKRWARKLIEDRYPAHRQNNVLMDGDQKAIETMRSYVQKVRAASNRIEALADGIPPDFRDPKYWT